MARPVRPNTGKNFLSSKRGHIKGVIRPTIQLCDLITRPISIPSNRNLVVQAWPIGLQIYTHLTMTTISFSPNWINISSTFMSGNNLNQKSTFPEKMSSTFMSRNNLNQKLTFPEKTLCSKSKTSKTILGKTK